MMSMKTMIHLWMNSYGPILAQMNFLTKPKKYQGLGLGLSSSE
jgi:hypothetical protein